MLPVVRVATSILVFLTLYYTGLFGLLLPLVSWLVNLCLLIFVSWAAGRTIANKYLIPRLPKTDTKNKAVIVTGCDSGFGYLTALKLNKEGFFVFATVINDEGEGAKKLLKSVQKKDRIKIVKLDVTKEEDIIRLHEEVNKFLNSGGPVNQLFGLVNNAGILLNRGVEYAKAPSVDDFKKMFEVNLFGMVRMSRMFLPLLRKSNGRIVNISSQAARSSTIAFVGYSCTKAASSKFTEGLQTELTRHGVTSIGIEPYMHKTGIINVDFMTKSIKDGWDQADEEVHNSYGTKARDEMIAYTRYISTDPVFVNQRTENVSDAVADALLSNEPQLVYECMQWSHWLLKKVLFDCMPWEIAVPISNLTQDLVAKKAPEYKS